MQRPLSKILLSALCLLLVTVLPASGLIADCFLNIEKIELTETSEKKGESKEKLDKEEYEASDYLPESLCNPISFSIQEWGIRLCCSTLHNPYLDNPSPPPENRKD